MTEYREKLLFLALRQILTNQMHLGISISIIAASDPKFDICKNMDKYDKMQDRTLQTLELLAKITQDLDVKPHGAIKYLATVARNIVNQGQLMAGDLGALRKAVEEVENIPLDILVSLEYNEPSTTKESTK